MKFIYGCQRVQRNTETGKLEHAPPVLVVEGEHVESGKIVDIDGPCELVTDPENRPLEVARCRDHGHTIWIQTSASIRMDSHLQPFRPDAKRVWVCSTVALAHPGTYSAGAIVFDTDVGQRSARHIRLLGPSRVIFDEHNPVSGYCPCRVSHAHRMWIETEGEIEFVA